MSLDLYLKSPTCPTCGRHDAPDFNWNYTYNVSRMWYEVYPDSNQMVDIDGMTCKESLPKLEQFRDTLKANPEKFRKMNPPNGWGDYESFVEAVESLIGAAKRFPNCVWESWR